MAKARFCWEDPLLLDSQLSESERMIRDAARDYCQGKLMPRVQNSFRHEQTDVAIFREMGEMGLLGSTLPTEYGGTGLNYVSYGLVAREVERIDSGYRSMMSVQSSLVMLPIFEFGTEAQKRKYLPKLASGELTGVIGCPATKCGLPTRRLPMSLSSGRKLPPATPWATFVASCWRKA
jgi:glutaryl-CoA dehydrogenase